MQKKINQSSWVAVPLSLALAVPPNLIAAVQATPAAQTSPATKAAGGPPPGTNADTGWPRTIALKTGTAVWYQPQVESWEGQKHIVAWSALGVPAHRRQRTGARHHQDRGARRVSRWTTAS